MTEETVTIGFKADVSGLKSGLKEASKATEDLKKGVEATQSTAANQSKGLRGRIGGISDSMGGIKDKMAAVSERIGGAVKKFGALGIAFAGVTLAAGKLYDLSGKTMRMYDPARFERYAGGLKKEVRKMKTTLGAVLAPVYQGMTKLFTSIAGWVNGFLETILKVVGYIQGLLGISTAVNETIKGTAQATEEAVEAASAGLASFDNVATLDVGEMGDMGQAQRISELMKQSAESGAKMRKSISDALEPLSRIGQFFNDLWTGKAWEGFVNSAGDAWEKVKTSFTDTLGGAWDWLKEKIGGIPGKFKEAWEGAVNSLKEKFGGAWDWLKDKASGIGDSLSRGLSKAFEKIKEIFDQTIGKVISGLDAAIKKVQQLLRDLGILKGEPQSDAPPIEVTGPITVPRGDIGVPQFAAGGVVEPNAPMLAVVGDNMREREVVSPLSTIRQAVSEALAAQGGTAPGNIELTVNLDGRTIARGTYDYLKAEAARRGTGGW